MALTRIVYPVVYAPATEQSYSRLLDLPPRVACPTYPILNFTSSLGLQWNCQKCVHHPYFGQYQRGDKIPLQLNLRDDRNGILFPPSTVTNPQIGWRQTDLINNFWYVRAELYDGNTAAPALIYSLVDDFCSDWWVGYSDLVGSIQTLIIDTSLFPLNLDSFRVKIVTIDAAGNDVITLWSEPFCINDNCRNSVLIQGAYSGVDCFNRDYRNPTGANGITAIKTPFVVPALDSLTPFYSSWRYSAEVVATGFTSEQTLNDNNKVIRSRNIETFSLVLSELLPPYSAQILAAMLQSGSFTIDGISYDTAGDVLKNIDISKAFLPRVDLTRICEINNQKCS